MALVLGGLSACSVKAQQGCEALVCVCVCACGVVQLSQTGSCVQEASVHGLWAVQQ